MKLQIVYYHCSRNIRSSNWSSRKSPAEITADVANNGLVLCGGGGLLNGLREYLSSKLGIMVHLASFPQETVIKGLIEYSSNSFVNKYEKEE